MPVYPDDAVCRKLGIDRNQLNSLFADEVIGTQSHAAAIWVGTEVAADIARRFGLDPAEPLGAQLADKGVLTEAEGRYLDDAD